MSEPDAIYEEVELSRDSLGGLEGFADAFELEEWSRLIADVLASEAQGTFEERLLTAAAVAVEAVQRRRDYLGLVYVVQVGARYLVRDGLTHGVLGVKDTGEEARREADRQREQLYGKRGR